jgi:hypothetical protein
MRLYALALRQKLLLAALAALFLGLASTSARAQGDPTAQVGRLSFIVGTVSVQPAGIDSWGQAYPNLPLGPGDRIFTDSDGFAEIQVGLNFVHIGHNADVTFIDATPEAISFGLAQGSVRVYTVNLWEGQALNVSTPNGTASIFLGGQFRVDVLPSEGATLFTKYYGNISVTGAGGFNQELANEQALELIGTNPVATQWLQPAPNDELGMWADQRNPIDNPQVVSRYVSREIPGAVELEVNGEWMPASDYGPVWFPRVAPGWAPYHFGHWVNHAPWGWIWVEDESWGYAPFHYGRWVAIGGRWGWIPGPPAAHPIWAPALVVFAGGIHFGGAGVSVWFPLGPGEPYRPWYPCSPTYINQVNITNITESRVVHVQNTYVNITNVTNVTYVNRTIGVTAMSHDDFAAGRSASQGAVKIDVTQLNHVTVLDRPEPKPTAASFVGHAPARPVPVKTERPSLINAKGKLVSAKPGAVAVEPPVRPAPVVKPLPGHTVAAPPAGAKAQPGAKAPAEPTKPEARPAEKPETKEATKPEVKPEDKTTPPPAKSTDKTKPADKSKKTDKDKKPEPEKKPE